MEELEKAIGKLGVRFCGKPNTSAQAGDNCPACGRVLARDICECPPGDCDCKELESGRDLIISKIEDLIGELRAM
jgi:hypothetical protein